MNIYKKGRFTIYLLVLLSLNASYCLSVDHVHHNKRSSSTLQFDVEPNANQVSNDHYTPVGTPSVSFTCTITRPHYRYTVKLIKEQQIANEPLSRKDIVLPGDFALNSELGDTSRFELLDDSDTAGLYRITFKIKDVKLSDNGKYICSYHNLHKSINLHVYEPLDEKDTALAAMDSSSRALNFHEDLDLKLKDAYKFVCTVGAVFPRPKIAFTINDEPLPNIEDPTEEIERKDDFYVVKSTAVAAFTVEKEQHNKQFKCVITPDVPGKQPIVKSVSLHVKGIDFFDNACADNVTAKVGEKDVKISCSFYAFPKPRVHWTSLSTDEASKENAEGNTVENNENGDEDRKVYKTLEHSEDAPYSITFEVSDPESDVYVATFTIKEYNSDKDFKELAINIENDETSVKRLFRFGPPGKAAVSALENGSTTLRQKSMHSIILALFIGYCINKFGL